MDATASWWLVVYDYVEQLEVHDSLPLPGEQLEYYRVDLLVAVGQYHEGQLEVHLSLSWKGKHP